ncbi:Forkhead box protein [Schistosoma japonicum]|uniref:Forkhead box protein n=1 Tax=Schistosoma japonicum TaxID=6182 RepID=A0A4Z2DXY8_SCHJA|nr:Forkhead box protein O [Schistosoma japonicum]TNN21110.1 Forkhead box protein [Schistosoma japonicum]
MSASYIRRDTLVSNPCTLSILSGPSISANEHKDVSSLSSIRSYPDQAMPSKHSPSASLSQQGNQGGIHSPKMSPDSTLIQLSTPSSFVSYLNSTTSLGISSGNPTTCDSFLRSALLSEGLEKQCVGSSTNLSMTNFHDSSTLSNIQPCSLLRPRAMTTSNASRSGTPVGNTPTSGSSACASAPTSTTPIKKSSRRNPWGSETYSDLISVAIRSYPDKQATLQQIYDFIITHYEYFRERSDPTSSAGWKNSIRHNLSLHDRFTKCPKSSDNTKSSYWRINPDVAAKPYVRRRACSMDTTNLKRPGPGHYAKMNNRSGGVTHRTSNNSSGHRLHVPSADSDITKPSLSPVCELQHPIDINYPSTKITGSRSSTCCGKDYNETNALSCLALSMSPSIDTCNTAKSMGFYHFPLQANTTNNNNSLCDNGSTLTCSNAQWPNAKSLTHHLSNSQVYNSNASSGVFNSGFSGLSCSTDQPPTRCRTSGLIEQLLRNDQNVGVNNISSSIHTIDRLSSDHFTSHSFFPCHSGKSSFTGNNSNLCSSLQQMETDYLSNTTDTAPQLEAIRQQSLHSSALLNHINSSRVSSSAAHHLLPVPLLTGDHHGTSTAAAAAAAAQSHWQAYRSNLHSSVASSFYPMCHNTTNFLSQSSTLQSPTPTNHFTSSFYDNSHLMHSSSDGKFIPFLNCAGNSTTSLSPSTNNSVSSSSGSWRHSLGLDMRLLSDSHISQRTDPITTLSTSCSNQSVMDSAHRSLGPITPPDLMYFPQTTVFSMSDHNIESPFQPQQGQTKQVSQSGNSMSQQLYNLGRADRSSVSNYATQLSSSSSPSSAFTSNPAQSRSSDRTYRDLRQYVEPYSYDDDCEPLELELSLELADRIVGSTTTTPNSNNPLTSSY